MEIQCYLFKGVKIKQNLLYNCLEQKISGPFIGNIKTVHLFSTGEGYNYRLCKFISNKLPQSLNIKNEN